MNTSQAPEYPIGTPGIKWGDTERAEWRSRQVVRRSYGDDVILRIEALKNSFDVESYGELSVDATRYPLHALKSPRWNPALPVALVTGGVHGYETSGVHGAIRFLETSALNFSDRFNIVVVPCVSPWGYETINRWNPAAVDPNRSFRDESPSEEVALLMKYVQGIAGDVVFHIDLHETTDTDDSEFRPALAARDGIPLDDSTIPDGFYLVGDSAKPAPDFQRAIVAVVEAVTHIAPADENGQIIGADLQQHGVINYPAGPLGLCMGMTHANYVTTTEVYPDSPEMDAETCIAAQVAAVVGGLNYVAQGPDAD